MKNHNLIKIIVSSMLVLSLFVSGCGKEEGENENSTTTQNTQKEEPKKKGFSMLKVSEKGYLVNEEGEEIVLKGVNFGGFLIQETWMGPVGSSESSSESLSILKQRGFTDEQIKAIYTSYAENFITEQDVKNVAKLGLNCIRLPFWYRNFMDEDCNFYSENPDEIFGFQMIDRIVEYADKNSIYVILDMHGCPGGQSTDHSCGIIGQNALYTNEKYLDAMQRIWEAIAERYKDCRTIAAYDIMNEPMNNNSTYENGWAAGSDIAVSHTISVYDRMVKAVRAKDSNHIITLEGVWSTDMLPDPASYGWTGIMYQLHLYDSTTDMINYRVSELEGVRRKYKVAIYVGEFNNGDTNQEYAYKKYNKSKISWTMWTYKVTKGNLGNWSLYYADIPNADMASDSYETILQKWGKSLDTKNFKKNYTVDRWLKIYSKD